METPKNGQKFDLKKFNLAKLAIRALANSLRIKILQIIVDKKEVNVNVIYGLLEIEQSITSQHLKVLRDANLVSTRRDGKMIYYTFNEERYSEIESAIKILLPEGK